MARQGLMQNTHHKHMSSTTENFSTENSITDATDSWFLPSRSCFTTVPADGSDGELDAARGGLSSATTVPRAREASLRKPLAKAVSGRRRSGTPVLKIPRCPEQDFGQVPRFAARFLQSEQEVATESLFNLC